MKSIVNKIILPVSLLLIVIFTTLILIVSNYSERTITSVYEENFKVISNQLTASIDRLNDNINYLKEIKVEEKRGKLSSLVDNAISIVKNNHQKYLNGEVSEEQAQKLAAEEIRVLKYDVNGYFWIDNTDYIVVMHGANESLEGRYRYDLEDKNGTFIVRDLVNQSVANGETYLSFWFPKPGESEASEKLGHSRLFKPWGWVVNTGFYIDEIDKEMDELRTEQTANFSQTIQSHNVEGTYPLIFTTDLLIVSSPNEEHLLKKVDILDPITNENILEKALKLKEGILEYNLRKSDGEIIPKMAYCKLHEEYDLMLMYTLDKSLVNQSVNSLNRLIIFVAIISGALSVIVIIITANRVVKNLRSITDKVYDISEGDGDLTHELNITSKDETGKLSDYLNTFISKLREIIINIKSIAN